MGSNAHECNLVDLSTYISDVIPIGGAHIKPPKPLPNDLQRFLDESERGVIYFSLGSILRTSTLPKDLINTFLGELHNQLLLEIRMSPYLTLSSFAFVNCRNT